MCVCVFSKLHTTAQSDPVILVMLCYSHWFSQGCVCVYVCVPARVFCHWIPGTSYYDGIYSTWPVVRVLKGTWEAALFCFMILVESRTHAVGLTSSSSQVTVVIVIFIDGRCADVCVCVCVYLLNCT